MKKAFLAVLIVFVGAIFALRWILPLEYYPPILMYHSLDPERKGTPTISLEGFSYQMAYIKSHGYKVISLEELARDLRKGYIPKKTVVITFDDGYKDNLKAVEVLKRYEFPATIFLIVSKIGKKGFLSPEEILKIERESPVRFGLHSVTHCVMYECKDPRFEIVEGKRSLEKMLNHEVKTFSYPVGGFNRRIISLVKKAGFVCAVTTNRGYSRAIDLYALRRIKMKDTDKGIKLWFKLSGYYDLFRKIKSPQ